MNSVWMCVHFLEIANIWADVGLHESMNMLFLLLLLILNLKVPTRIELLCISYSVWAKRWFITNRWRKLTHTHLGSLINFYPQSSFTTMHYVCAYTSFTVLGLDWLDVGYRRRPFYSIHAPYRDEGRWGTMDQHAEGILWGLWSTGLGDVCSLGHLRLPHGVRR